MNNEATKQLCLSLLRADSEDEVIRLLTDAGYWERSEGWREYGDKSGNFSTIGNQQSRPEAALVEKIINSVDARLTNECLTAGIDPCSTDAPTSVRDAVARFFEDGSSGKGIGGSIREWSAKKRGDESHNITLAATGSRYSPSLTLVDTGEGQTPNKMPDTFLSIDRENKLRIRFVQGTFNMGGTGALKFCGKNSVQLIISRRNPAIVKKAAVADQSSAMWGFTVVRRERPTKETGSVRNSVYTYLAPFDSDKKPHRGEVLRFDASSLMLMPKFNEPYAREIEWGSAIKLYNYDIKSFSGQIVRPDGLLYRLDVLLPEIALPIRLHECRTDLFKGKKEGSFDTPLAGLVTRLEEGRGDNLEDGYPSAVPFTVNGEHMTAKLYAFKKNSADTYRSNEGVIFYINGQTHGYFPKSIFQRKNVKMHRLASALLVLIDCSSISIEAREDLFMNSRDRLSSGELRKAVERQVEDIIAHHAGLKELRARRISEENAEQLADEKPLENVLNSILKSSPSLSSLFLRGQRLSVPHKKESQSNGSSGASELVPFKGKVHPTFFHFHKLKKGEGLRRECEVGRRCRLKFETDMVNDYFSRSDLPGRYHVEVIEGGNGVELNNNLIPHNGIANWSIEIPADAEVGSTMTLLCTVADDLNPEGFTNTATLTLSTQIEKQSGVGQRQSAGANSEKDGRKDDSGIQMPKIRRIREINWGEYNFDKHSACKIQPDDEVEEVNGQTSYIFYINVDNIYLKTDMKVSKEYAPTTEARFIYGNVLIGLALLHDRSKQQAVKAAKPRDDEKEDETIEEEIERTARALAPFIVPMIESLGALTAEDIASMGQIGDDE